MITENLSTLKIHKLTQAQYDRELEAGNLDATALYLTPDEEIDLSPYATVEQLNQSYTDVETALSNKADANHEHDDYLPLGGGELTGDLRIKEFLQFLDSNNTGAYISGGYENNEPYLEILGTENDEQVNLRSVSIDGNAKGITGVTTNNYLVGNGDENMIEKTPDEVWSHIKSAGKNVEGTEFVIESESIVANQGAEIFNNYDSNIATGIYSHAEGCDTKATGGYSHAEGYLTVASGDISHVEGECTVASGWASHAEGSYTNADGWLSHAEGDAATASGQGSHAEGYHTEAKGDYSHAEGYCTIANDFQHASGKYNEEKTAPATADTQDTTNADAVFLIGYGTSTTRANAFRVTSGGKCRGASSFSATGADFAELFEWADGNPNNEDRRGLFVALDGDKIKLANSEDDYIGVISGDQAFIGNTASEEWQGKYLTDVFGTRLYQEVETPNGTATQYIINPDYNPDEEYIMRENRKEWGIVGLLGQVVVVDDGTCVVGGHVKPSVNGVGTSSDNGYRVMKRIDDNHIKVLVK